MERALGVMLVAKVLMHDAELVLTTGSAEAQPAPGAQDGAAVPSASVSASLQRRGSLKISGHHGRAAEGGETIWDRLRGPEASEANAACAEAEAEGLVGPGARAREAGVVAPRLGGGTGRAL